MKRHFSLAVAFFFLLTACDFNPIQRFFGSDKKTEIKKGEKESKRLSKKAQEPPASQTASPPQIPKAPEPPPQNFLKQVSTAEEPRLPLASFLHLGGAPTLLQASSARVIVAVGR